METIPQSRPVERLSSSCTRLWGLWPAAPLTPGGAGVDRDAAADEVDRGVLPLGEDRVGLALDLDRGLLDEPAVAELVEEHLEPALAGQPPARLAGR